MLISAIVGINSRTTMDMDTTIKGFSLTKENINNILTEICNIKLEDNVKIILNKIEFIREDDKYGGYRASFEANYNNELPVIMKIDITTGDQITYKEIDYSFKLLLENRKINIWSYNLETIVAEKFETIISRNIFTTRIRDFYDVHMLMKLHKNEINKKILKDAIKFTAIHRETEKELDNSKNILHEIENDIELKKMWVKYQKQNYYAKDISYEELIKSIKEISDIYQNN